MEFSKKIVVYLIMVLIFISVFSTLFFLESITKLKKTPKLETSNKGQVSLTIIKPSANEDFVKSSDATGKLALNIEKPE